MHTLLLKSPDDTVKYAQFLALHAEKGDVILLSGELGAGKSLLSRAFIHAFLGAETHVQSPTFPLVQIYEQGKCPIWHCDLYRLKTPEETLELGLEEAFSQAITIIEWPERLGHYKPKNYLQLVLSLTEHPMERMLKILPAGNWVDRSILP
jgi:tRNA threonylcarbamoyladenosine biosynthesis protein TsaE